MRQGCCFTLLGFFIPFIFISWRLITLQYYSGFAGAFFAVVYYRSKVDWQRTWNLTQGRNWWILREIQTPFFVYRKKEIAYVDKGQLMLSGRPYRRWRSMRWTSNLVGLEYGNKVGQFLMYPLFKAGEEDWGRGSRVNISENNLLLWCHLANSLGLYSFWWTTPIYRISGTDQSRLTLPAEMFWRIECLVGYAPDEDCKAWLRFRSEGEIWDRTSD